MKQYDYPELEGLINLCNDISEGRRDAPNKTWDEIFIEYGKVGFTNAKLFSKWLKENYEAPIKKQ
jgi:hypothetical protein